jgi:hypothetical protein
MKRIAVWILGALGALAVVSWIVYGLVALATWACPAIEDANAESAARAFEKWLRE